MALYVSALYVLFCVVTVAVSIATGQTSECGNIPSCLTSANNNCLCYKILSGDMYGICSCTYSYSLDMHMETGIRECCLIQASVGENCNSDSQCQLSSADLVCIGGFCQCHNGYNYKNETDSCVETTKTDFSGTTATVAVGTTCIVLVLIIVLLILLFMHRKAKTERQLSYLRNRINTRGPYSSSNAENGETIKDSSPPSYTEIERGDTPPPPFESLTSISDDNEVRGSE